MVSGGLSTAQLGLMAQIAVATDDTLSALALRTGLDQSTLSRNLRTLENADLIEIAVVIAVVGVLAAIAVPNINEWSRHQRLRGAARDVGDLLVLARSDAIRTGRRQIVSARMWASI